MKNVKLSHSSVERYLKCPRSYRLHYVDRLRPTTTSSNLIFGVAIDEALNALLLKQVQPSPESIFEAKMQTCQINSKDVVIPFSNQITYGRTDFDEVILLPEDLDVIDAHVRSLGLSGTVSEYITSIFNSELKFYQLSPEEQNMHNFFSWVSLKRKGLMILAAYREQILPLLGDVVTVQKEIILENEQGDKLTGIIDLVARLKDTGELVVLDNKTSRVKYKTDSVALSPQLALYSNHEETTKAGFIVLVKTIKKDVERDCAECQHNTTNTRIKNCDNTVGGKRCNGQLINTVTPRVETQFIVDDVDMSLVATVLERYQAVGSLIKADEFPKNHESCYNFYGSRCPYFDKCHGNSDEGLEQV